MRSQHQVPPFPIRRRRRQTTCAALVLAVAALVWAAFDWPAVSIESVQTTEATHPMGTLYWGGAGLDGPYVQPQIDAFERAEISSVRAGKTLSATNQPLLGPMGMFVDALRAGSTYRYRSDQPWRIIGMDAQARQFNLIGYSYGSLLAAQTAAYYADQGQTVDHLVLIGSPIDRDFLFSLQHNPRIRKVVVINLTQFGDPIFAGMTQVAVAKSMPTIRAQMARQAGQGHFYYAQIVPDSQERWAALATRLHREGLR